jgi:4-amino-4-deoxy-L-arabinose transferase-like glycosyltransferase
MKNGIAHIRKEGKLSTIALFLLVLALTIPRLTALGRYVTIDEPFWLRNSANFYQALWTRNWQNTYQLEHPGVTITWAGTLGFFWEYPGYVKMVDGQFNNESKFREFLASNGHSALDVLVAGRAFTALGVVLILLLAFPLLVRLVGWWLALLALFLIALDPYFTALSRLLHLDGLLAALMFLSLLAFISYQEKGRRRLDLILSGVAAGLSWLTKSPAFFLIPFMGLLVLIELFNSWKRKEIIGWRGRAGWIRTAWRAARPWLAWLIIGVVIFILFWPAMWVDPIGTLGKVFGGATDYALEGNSHVTFFAGQVIDVGQTVWYYYPLSILWRISPPELIGLFLLVVGLLFPKKLTLSRDQRRMAWVMGLFSLLFIIFITLSQKKADRYQIPVQPALCVLAALGWYALFVSLGKWAGQHFSGPPARLLAPFLGGAIVFWQLLGILQTAPYYMNYYNPLLGGDKTAPQAMMIGRGEGLDLAARYLNGLPDARHLDVYAWYGEGPFSYYFTGNTRVMEENTNLDELLKADYVVIYIQQWQRQAPSKAVLDYFARLRPVFVARIGNLDYAQVYGLRGSKN